MNKPKPIHLINPYDPPEVYEDSNEPSPEPDPGDESRTRGDRRR